MPHFALRECGCSIRDSILLRVKPSLHTTSPLQQARPCTWSNQACLKQNDPKQHEYPYQYTLLLRRVLAAGGNPFKPKPST